MGRKIKNIEGLKVGRLTVLSEYKRENGLTFWKCICNCENKSIKFIQYSNLISGKTTSCGCYQEELNHEVKHGLSRTRLFRIWKGILKRCYDENNYAYSNYGGRGIRVCDEWLIETDYEGLYNFYNWAMENGYSDELTIDRINVDGIYEPKNCRWSTYKEQNSNKRNNVYIEIEGESKSLAEWAEFTGIDIRMIHKRVKQGKKGLDIIKPIQKRIAEKQSGEKYVSWDKRNKSWRLTIKGKIDRNYKTVEEAVEAKNKYLREEVDVE